MGCCIRNCYGIELDEIEDRVKESIPRLLLDFLLDLTKCTNSQSQKNGLANWNQLNIFAANKVFDKLTDLNNNEGYLDLSSPEKIFESILEKIIKEFNDLMCNGGSSGLEDLDNKYNTDKDGNPIIKFPGDLTDNEKDKIRDIIDDNDFFDDNLNGGGNNNSGGNIVVDKDDGNGNGEDYFGGGSGNGNDNGNNGNDNGSNGNGNGGNGNGDGNGNNGNDGNGNGNDGSNGGNGNGNGNDGSNGGNGNGNGDGNGSTDNGSGNGNNGNDTDTKGPIWNIPNDEIKDVDLITQIYKCFTPVFHIENYVFSTVKTTSPVFLTTTRLKRIKRIHNELLLPIYYHYFGEDAPPTCQIRITFCLSSYANIVEFIGGEAHSKHLTGEAVDISIVGINSEKVISDIRNKILDIDFGVLYDKGGLHFTLPYTFENLDVRRMYLSSPKKGRNSLEVEFI